MISQYERQKREREKRFEKGLWRIEQHGATTDRRRRHRHRRHRRYCDDRYDDEDEDGAVSLENLTGKHVPDDHPNAPLLPPNLQNTKFLGMLPETWVEHTDANAARSYYQFLCGESRAYRRSDRKYLRGSLYTRILGSPLTIQPQVGKLIRLSLGPKYGIILIGCCTNRKVTTSLLQLSRACSKHTPNTCRKNIGEVGKMWAMGYRNKRTGLEFGLNKDPIVAEAMTNMARHCGPYVRKRFPTIYASIRSADAQTLNHAIRPLRVLGGRNAVGNQWTVTRGFYGASHYDLEKSLSFFMWVEEIQGDAKDWYFVLPNVLVDGRHHHGVVIRLGHGVCVGMDGTKIRHCTSGCTYMSEANEVTGFWLGAK